MALTAAGLAFLAATLGDTADEAHSDYAVATLVLYAGGAAALGFAAAAAARATAHGGTLLAVSAGPRVGSVRRVDQGAQRAPRRRLRGRDDCTRSRW